MYIFHAVLVKGSSTQPAFSSYLSFISNLIITDKGTSGCRSEEAVEAYRGYDAQGKERTAPVPCAKIGG